MGNNLKNSATGGSLIFGASVHHPWFYLHLFQSANVRAIPTMPKIAAAAHHKINNLLKIVLYFRKYWVKCWELNTVPGH